MQWIRQGGYILCRVEIFMLYGMLYGFSQVLCKRHTTPHWVYGSQTFFAAECIYHVPGPAEPCNPCRRLRGDPNLLKVVRIAPNPHSRTPLVNLGHVTLQKRHRKLYQCLCTRTLKPRHARVRHVQCPIISIIPSCVLGLGGSAWSS